MNQVIFASGCYTEIQNHAPSACGQGIEILSFDEDSGRLDRMSIHEGLINPCYLEWVPEAKALYALTENTEGVGEVRSFSVRDDLTLLPGPVLTGTGSVNCHLKVMPELNRVYAASYEDGSLKLFPMAGELSCSVFHYSGTGPNRSRQEKPHAHQVLPGPEGRFLYVCDLGSDRVWIHDARKADPAPVSSLQVPAGYGPRHLAVDHRNGYVYILCELIPRLLTARINPADGSLALEQDLPSCGSSAPAHTAPAAVKIHPSGNSVAVSNRFDDTISVFAIRSESEGRIVLDKADSFNTGGKTPRDICFSPSGRWLLMAHQDSSDIQVRAFDPDTGLPADVRAESFQINTPVCLVPLV